VIRLPEWFLPLGPRSRDKMDEAIIQHLKRKYNLLIGNAPLNSSRSRSARPTRATRSDDEIRGRDLVGGVRG